MIQVYSKAVSKDDSANYLRQSLGQFLDKDPATLEIKRHPTKQPYLETDPTVYFSLSHSQNYTAVACSHDFAVGLDLQIHEGFRSSLFSTICTAREVAEIKELNEVNFFKIWTIKEACLKCLGTGLQFPMNQLEINFADQKVVSLNSKAKYKTMSYVELHLFSDTTAHLVWTLP